MDRLRSGVLAAWTSAWLNGAVSLLDLLAAVEHDDAPHGVAGEAGIGLRDVLVDLRSAGTPARLVLPVSGDLRGVPGPGEFRAAALAAREAVLCGAVGLVPSVMDRSPSSAPPSVLWHRFVVDAAPADAFALTDAQHELADAIRRGATAFSEADVAHWSDDLADGLDAARRAGERLDLPPGFPPLAVALLAQTERLHAVLALASRDEASGAVDRAGVQARADGLRELADAVRRARLAGYNALTEAP